MKEIELFSGNHVDYEEFSNEDDFLIEEDNYDEGCDDNNSGYQDDDLNDYLDEYLWLWKWRRPSRSFRW